MTETALVTREQERATATALYGQDQDIKRTIQAIRTVAPWVTNQDPKLSFNDNEIALVVRRSMAMGLDPLNQHEVQIWKDRRGTVNFQLSYTLMTEWVRHFKGTHTEPRYHELTKEELLSQGLKPNDHAVTVSFVMDSDVEKLSILADIYGVETAKQMCEVHGTGTATAQEWAGNYFAPAGRSKLWKVQKRALTDAYRRKFGTPTRSDIEELRRIGGFERMQIEDWQGTQGLNPSDAAALAKDRARHREHQERLTDDPEYKAEFDVTVKAAESLMYPAPEREPQAVDGEFTEMPQEPEPTPDPDSESGDAWNDEIIREAKAIGGAIRKAAGWTINGGWHRAEAKFIGDSQQSRMLASTIGKALQGVPGVDKDKPHHALIAWLFNAEGGSTKNLTDREAGVSLARWTGADGDKFTPTETAIQEIRALFQGAQLLSGQQRLPLA